MKKIVFLTGTRADYGKIKPLIESIKPLPFQVYLYVTGMHLLEKFGSTYQQIVSEQPCSIFLQPEVPDSEYMDINLGKTIQCFSEYIRTISPDMVIVHGDRIDALAGATVAMLNNVILAHIEGGELTGTVDESIRHAISKMANLHFVSNEESKQRLVQLGEVSEHIYIIGSPDIDSMLYGDLPTISSVKEKYKIPFQDYAILIYHPVTSEVLRLERDIHQVMEAIVASNKNYLIIYPNNDLGSQLIFEAYNENLHRGNLRFFESIPFEEFLTLLKYSQFIIGNSSAGVREACVYGIPAIDIGTRQNNRYSEAILPNILKTPADKDTILKQIDRVKKHQYQSFYFGDGKSAEKFRELLLVEEIWSINTQKQFVDLSKKPSVMEGYINEVCY